MDREGRCFYETGYAETCGNARGERGAARKMKNYYSIILVFILGGAIGALVTNAVGEKALLLTLVPLAAVFLIMFIEEEREELEEEISGGRA